MRAEPVAVPARAASFWSRVTHDGVIVEASLWSADAAGLGAAVTSTQAYADLFHVDVADAHFVPDLLFSPHVVAALRPLTGTGFHAHLMVTDPVPVAAAFAAAGADLITVHVETGAAAGRAIEKVKAGGCGAGLAVRVDTDVSAVVPHLDTIDAVVMVNTPLGTKGTRATPQAYARISAVRALLAEHAPDRDIRVLADGGIRRETVPRLVDAGAHGVVAGSLLFGSADPAGTTRWIREGGQPA